MAKTLGITPLADSIGSSPEVAVEFYLQDGSDEVYRKIVPIASLQILYMHQEEQITVNSGGSHLFSFDATNVTAETGFTTVEDLFTQLKSQLYI
jgi:hypothetical protein